MLNATRTDHRNLGRELAAKREAAMRKPRNGPRRGSRHPRSRTKRPDPRVKVLEATLERSELGRNALRLSDDLALARLTEEVLAWGLQSVEQTERLIRQQLAAAERDPSVEAIEQAHLLRCRLADAEPDAADWRRKLAAARTERERLEIELQLWTRGV